MQRVQDQTEREREKRTPLLTLTQMSIADLLREEPPEREWIIDNILPLGVTGTLSAAGGTGKSWAMVMLALSMAMEIDFWGLGTPRPGGVLILSAEDDRSEFHRRLHIALRHILETTGQNAHGVSDRIAFADRVGGKNLLTAIEDGQITRTDLADRIVATAEQVPDCRLIIADPLSRFRGGSANGEEEATRFVEALEYLRKETGCTVLVPSHTGKESGRMRDGSQHAVRGSSALVDGMRWVGTLMHMSEEEANQRGIGREECRKWVRLEIPKNNYAPPFPGAWLHRIAGGVLIRDEPAEISKIVETMPKADREYERVLSLMVQYVRDEGAQGRVVYQSQLKMLAGVSGMFGVGEKQVRAILGRAINEEKLVKVRDQVDHKLFQILVP
jgi:RecA-family ATPase